MESLLLLPYEVELCKGGDNVIADALTRMYREGGENVETPSNGINETNKISVQKTQSSPSFLPATNSRFNKIVHKSKEKKSNCFESLNSGQSHVSMNHFTNLVSNIPEAFIDLKTHQLNDHECLEIIWSKKNKTNNNSYFLKNEVLMYVL